MALRVCVLGNSHVASLKGGWDIVADNYPGVELVFFACRGNALSELKRDGRALVATTHRLRRAFAHTSGGIETVDVDAYDRFLCYGLSLNMPWLNPHLSEAVRVQCCLDVWGRSLNKYVCDLLGPAAEHSVSSGHVPQPANADRPGWARQRLDYAGAYSYMAPVVGASGVRLLRQPETTFSGPWYSKAEFARQSKRLDIGDAVSSQPLPKADRGHLNAAFGAAFLEAYLGSLRRVAEK